MNKIKTALSVVKAALSVAVTFIVSFAQILNPYFQTMGSLEDRFYTDWSAESEYKLEDTIVIEKSPDKDFVILNLTDIQLTSIKACGEEGELAENMIKKLVSETKPDLITMTGDNAKDFIAYLKLIEFMESLEIPWAPVMGNHDGEGMLREAWAAYSLAEAEHCLFKFGPKDMGYGNYIINITENDKIIHSLIMMDTHSNKMYTDKDGKEFKGYDHVWPNQIEWYKWAVNGAAKLAGEDVQTSVFMHIPVVEYGDAWNAAWDEETQSFVGEYADTSFGVKHEPVGCAPENNGFFSVIKSLGSTKDVVCGHEHVSNYSIVYEGVRLTYALKTGVGSYWEAELNGGTKMTVNKNGTNISHLFVDLETLEIY